MTKMSRFAVAATVAVSIHVVAIAADQLASGRNVNVHPGVVDQYVGDKFLQRQVEPKVVCSSANTQHCVAMANDYRTVDATADSFTGLGEGVARLRLGPAGTKSIVAAAPDAWLGLYRTANGGQNWLNGMLPGSPNDTTVLGQSQPWYGLAAGSDAGLATDGVHFFGVGLFFNRGGTSMVGAFRLTDYNDESSHPIRWDAAYSRVLDQGNSPGNGQFADLPSVVATPLPASGCGNVYVAYTNFSGFPTNNSFINFVRSTDCGNTWTKPLKLQGNYKKNQRVTLVVDPRPGMSNTLYAAWRSFGPDQIVGTRSVDGGLTWVPPVAITPLSGPANLCAYDQPTISSMDNPDPNAQTARALAFPSYQVDSNGAIFAVWAERVSTTGAAVSGGACKTSLQPKIVITKSSDGGATWTLRRAVDMGLRCETTVGIGQAAGLDKSSPNGTCPQGTTPRVSGPQIQPVLSHNAGKIMLVYQEGRGGLNSSGWHSGRNTQMDVRAAQINPATLGLLSTTQVSLYAYDLTGNIKKVENAPGSTAYNRPYLPQYKAGTTPFRGDHDDLAPAETVVWESPAHYPTASEVPGARFVTMFGGDNRESLFPGGNINGDWSNYVDPASGDVSKCNAGIRNSNDYFAYVGAPTEAFAHQTFKPGGVLQRTWAVTVRNHSDITRLYRFTLDEKTASDGSFHQFQNVNEIGNMPSDPLCALPGNDYPVCTAYRMILPRSSMTFTIFGTIGDATVGAPIKVNVFEAQLDTSGRAVNPSLVSIVRLNPNPNNLAGLVGHDIATKEFHGPNVSGPQVHTYANPTSGNPTSGNPTSGNPTSGNPTSGNPTSGNTGFAEYTDYQYKVKADTGTNTTSALSTFANISNADLVDNSHIAQMIITRTHTVPTMLKTANGCEPKERVEDEVISTITVPSRNLGVPTSGNPTSGNPTSGNPTSGNPTSGNPTSGNPTSGNQTFAVAPISVTPASASSEAFRANALAGRLGQFMTTFALATGPDGTIVGNPDMFDEVSVTVRFYHCTASGGCTVNEHHYDAETDATETVPKTQDAAGTNSLIGFTAIAEAGNNNNGTISDPAVDGAGPPDLTIVSGTPTPTNGTTFEPGDKLDFPAWTERNTGGTTANPNATQFHHGYYLSTDAVITATDTLLADNVTTETFPPQTQVTFSAGSVFLPTNLAPGTYYFGILADNQNNIVETNESNNFVSAAITIIPPPSTMVVTDTDVVSAGAAGMRSEVGPYPPAGNGAGTINLAGVSGTVTKALLFWNGPTNTSNGTANATIMFNGNSVTGVNVGFASSNLWDGYGPAPGFNNSQSYRANVTAFVAGNAAYSLAGFTQNGADINGASLVVFFNDGISENNSDVYLVAGNDSNLASSYEAADWSTTVPNVNNLGFGASIELHVSDGQEPADDGGISVNGTLIVPSGEIFNGTYGVTQSGGGFKAWDVRAFGINSALSPGVQNVTVTAPFVSDALSIVVAVVKIARTLAPPIQ